MYDSWVQMLEKELFLFIIYVIYKKVLVVIVSNVLFTFYHMLLDITFLFNEYNYF